MFKRISAILSSPPRLTFFTFFALILMGTFLLMLPISLKEGADISFIDALFTATSASCVTGLVIHDTGQFFSGFGQGVLLVLIQLGGLGIMTLSIALPLILGRSLGLGQRSFYMTLFDQKHNSQISSLLKSIIKYTFLIEAIGALILSIRWYSESGNLKEAIYHGVFHSISAFCNAGFALFELGPFKDDFWVMGTLSALIILGGLGFAILHAILTLDLLFDLRKIHRRISANMKLTLTTTWLLVFIPAVFFFFVEFDTGMTGENLWTKLSLSLFQSITSRTAGFNTIDLNQWSYASIFLYSILMFIGASPGGTGGGVKTTTFGVLFLSIKSILLKKKDIQCYGRRVASEDVTKSIAIIMLSFSVITFFMLVLFITEKAPFHQVFFEVISAFGTVGSSLGLTSQLSNIGKVSICFLMLFGRVGPLTMTLSLGTTKKEEGIKLPEDHFIVG